MSNDILNQRYPTIRPQGFIELSVQIQQLYDGPWVVMGSTPDDGCNNPNPQDQAKARSKWRNAYRMLKPYEKQIEEDYNLLETIESPYLYDGRAELAIRAMYDICQKYHDVVEPWDMTEVAPEEPIQKKQVEEKPVETYSERMHNARTYLEASHSFFVSEVLPALSREQISWAMELPEEGRVDAINKRKEVLKDKLLSSGFFNYYSVTIPQETQYVIDNGFCTDEESNAVYWSVQSSLALEDMFDGGRTLNIDKLALYMYDNQKKIKHEAVSQFFKYIELTKILNGFLGPEDLLDEFVADIEGNRLSDPLFTSVPPEPEQVRYDMDKAMDYYAEKEEVFKKKHLPKLEQRIMRWWSRVTPDKQVDAIKNRLEGYENEFKQSDFLRYYQAYVDNAAIREIYEYADDGYQAQRCVDDLQYQADMYDLYDGIDILNIEKIERYVWVNQKRITDGQLFAFLTYDTMKTYLPSLLKKDDKPVVVETVPMPEPEEKVAIDIIFCEGLQKNAKAAKELIRVLTEEVGPKTCTRGGSRTNKWKWWHVRRALLKLRFVDEKSNYADFARGINPHVGRSEGSIHKSTKEDPSDVTLAMADQNIVDQIAGCFESVRKLLDTKS